MNMSKELKKDWLPKLQLRYARRNREGKSRMLDELCADYEYERKYAIKLLCGGLPAPGGRVHPGPELKYGLIEPAVRQTPGADPAAVAAVLRTAAWPVEPAAAAAGREDQRGHPGPTAGARAGATLAGPLRNQAGEPVALRNSDTHGHLGFEPAGIFGGRQRGPLRREHGRGFHLEPDLYGHIERLDRRRGGVEQGRGRRAGGHAGGGGALALRAAGI